LIFLHVAIVCSHNTALILVLTSAWGPGLCESNGEQNPKGVKFGRKPKLTDHQKREAIKRRDAGEETYRSIGRSYNVSAATISRLAPA
jgi:CENP-B N-terminal DNA-binding domain